MTEEMESKEEQEVFQNFRYSFVREYVHIVHVDPKRDDAPRSREGISRRPRAIHG